MFTSQIRLQRFIPQDIRIGFPGPDALSAAGAITHPGCFDAAGGSTNPTTTLAVLLPQVAELFLDSEGGFGRGHGVV